VCVCEKQERQASTTKHTHFQTSSVGGIVAEPASAAGAAVEAIVGHSCRQECPADRLRSTEAGSKMGESGEQRFYGESQRLGPKLTRRSRKADVAPAVHNLEVTHSFGRLGGGEEGCCGFRRAGGRQVMGALGEGRRHRPRPACADGVGRGLRAKGSTGDARPKKRRKETQRRFQKSKQFPKRPAVLNNDIALDEKQPLSPLAERRDTACQSAAPADIQSHTWSVQL
jgi:hypothetical protein